jgi:membrane-bound metal-dependent hydrolase YbcI (DUF457 family)
VPLTPLHYVLAYFFYHIGRKKLNFPVLIISSMIPDLEVPPLYLITNGLFDRLILHSIIGSIIIGIPLTILIVYPIYRWIFLKFFIINRNEFRNSSNYYTLIFSALLGVLSHIFIDATHHPFNPLLWPITIESVNNLILFDNLILASNILFMFIS